MARRGTPKSSSLLTFSTENNRIEGRGGNLEMKRFDKDIIRNTLSIAWPAIIESFFAAFAGLVDALMVSSLGPDAVAAVGLTTQPKFVGLAVFFALNVSISALVARRRGEKKREEANRILITALLFIVAAAILLGALFVTLSDGIIALCGSTSETHEGAVAYFQIIMGGMIFNCIQMGINSAQRGAGNTRITMRTNLTSNTINIIANYLLINGNFGFPAWGIRGAALATVFGTVVASFMSIFSITGKDGFISLPYIISQKIRPRVLAFTNLVRVGYSVFFEQLLMRIGFMLTALMAANQGMNAMAAHQVGMNILSLSFAFGDGLQSTAVALIGRSLGEKNEEMAKRYGAACQRIGGIISICLAVIYFFGARFLYGLYFREEHIVAIGVNITYVIIFVVIFQVRQVIYMGCLRGAGDTFYTAMASTVSVTVIRTLGSYICGYVLGFGIIGIWMGIVADQVSRFLFASIRFRKGSWTKIRI